MDLKVSSTSNFKKILTILCFFTVAIITVISIGKFYKFCASKNKVNLWSKQRFDEFYKLEKNSLDMLFVGSSHSYCTFDPLKINKLMGIKSYQLGLPGQMPDSSYYTIKEALKTQKPKTIVLEVYWELVDDTFNVRQADNLFSVLNDEQTKTEFIKNDFPISEKVKYKLDFIRYQEDFINLADRKLTQFVYDKLNFMKRKKIQGKEYYRSLGYTYCNIVMTPEEIKKEENKIGIDGRKYKANSKQEDYIYKIADLCKQNGIELVLVTAPISLVAYENIENYDVINSTFSTIADKCNARYLDYNIISRNHFKNEHFRDPRHLNDDGVLVADKYFDKWYNNK